MNSIQGKSQTFWIRIPPHKNSIYRKSVLPTPVSFHFVKLGHTLWYTFAYFYAVLTSVFLCGTPGTQKGLKIMS